MYAQKVQNGNKQLQGAIEAYKSGDIDKATIIYENTQKYTYQIIRQHVGSFKSQGVLTGDENAITEDVMQELYLDFFFNIGNFRNEEPNSFYKWISIVSKRMVLKYVDKNKMEVLQYEQITLPEAAFEVDTLQEVMARLVKSLPLVQAQTIFFHFYEGMKYQEIANEMGVSLITVKTRMKKAKDSLATIVIQYEKETGTQLRNVSALRLLWFWYHVFLKNTAVLVMVAGMTKANQNDSSRHCEEM